MKESKAVYVTKRDIRENLLYKDYQFYANNNIVNTIEINKYKLTNDVGIQYNSKRDNVYYAHRNFSSGRKYHEHDLRYFNPIPKQIYTYSRSKSFTDIGVGSVKALQKKKVKKIYLPETDDRGVGSSDLTSFITRMQSLQSKSKAAKQYRTVQSYYESKKTSSKCVGGAIENRPECLVSAKVSPIVHTQSGSTSPKDPGFRERPKESKDSKDIEIETTVIEKQLVTTDTQFEEPEAEVLPEKNLEVIIQKPIVEILLDNSSKVPNHSTEEVVATVEVKLPETKHSETNQSEPTLTEPKHSETKHTEPVLEVVLPEKKTEKPEILKGSFSSDSLVQHVHNLEEPSEYSKQRDPMENKMEREYRKMFSSISRDQKTDNGAEKQQIPQKSTSLFRRRFTAIRKSLGKKDSKNAVVPKQSSVPSVRDASITSDPPSLEERSFSSINGSPSTKKKTKRRTSYKKSYTGKKSSKTWSKANAIDSEYGQGVKGMFKLWGKKFNLDDTSDTHEDMTQPSSFEEKPKAEDDEPKEKGEEPKQVPEVIHEDKNEEKIFEKDKEKKEGKKFFFFKKKHSKDKAKNQSMTYKSKKGVTTGRCEVKDGLSLRMGAARSSSPAKSKTPPPRPLIKKELSSPSENYEDMVRTTWLMKYLSNPIESRNSVKVRWNNKTYTTSSSTIMELMGNVYKNTGIVLKSKSEITTDASSTWSYRPNVNFVQHVEAWMIPKTVLDHKISVLSKTRFKNSDAPNISKIKTENEKQNIEVTISDQKWIIDKSKAFAQNIEVVLHSKNFVKLHDPRSADCIRINIPKGFFSDTSSDEPQPEHSSEEEVYNIVEYESANFGPELEHAKARQKVSNSGDHSDAQDIQVTVSVKNGLCEESKIMETVIKRPPVHRDVVIQGSNVYIPKVWDVIGVGIITQRDTREVGKPILQFREYMSDEESVHSITMGCPSRQAKSCLDEYYRHWQPLGLDMFSWCYSDSHMQCCSEHDSRCSYDNGDVSKSCPNIFEEYVTMVSSYSSGGCQNIIPCYEKKKKKEKKVKKGKKDDAPYRVSPKDSVEVFKIRKIHAVEKSKWIDDCSTEPYSVPSNADTGVQRCDSCKPKKVGFPAQNSSHCCKPLCPEPATKPAGIIKLCGKKTAKMSPNIACTIPDRVCCTKGSCNVVGTKEPCYDPCSPYPPPCPRVSHPPADGDCPPPPTPPPCISYGPVRKTPCASPCSKSAPRKAVPPCPPSPPPCPPSPPPCKTPCPIRSPPCKEKKICREIPRSPNCKNKPPPPCAPLTCPGSPPRQASPPCSSSGSSRNSCKPEPPQLCNQNETQTRCSPTCSNRSSPTCPPTPPKCCVLRSPRRCSPCPSSPPPCPSSPPRCPSSPPPCPTSPPPCPPSPPPCPSSPSTCPPSPQKCPRPKCPTGMKLSNTDCIDLPKPRQYGPPPCPPCPPKTPPCPTKTPPCPPKTPPCPPKPPPCPPKSPPCSPSPPCPTQTCQAPSSCSSTPSCPSPCPNAAPPCPTQTPPCPTQAPPCPAQAPPCPAQAPPCPAQAPPCPAQTPPCPAQAPPCPAQAPPCPAQTPPCPAQTPPCPVQTPPCPAQAPPCPAQAPPCPAQPPPCPTQTPPCPLRQGPTCWSNTPRSPPRIPSPCCPNYAPPCQTQTPPREAPTCCSNTPRSPSRTPSCQHKSPPQTPHRQGPTCWSNTPRSPPRTLSPCCPNYAPPCPTQTPPPIHKTLSCCSCTSPSPSCCQTQICPPCPPKSPSCPPKSPPCPHKSPPCPHKSPPCPPKSPPCPPKSPPSCSCTSPSPSCCQTQICPPCPPKSPPCPPKSPPCPPKSPPCPHKSPTCPPKSPPCPPKSPPCCFCTSPSPSCCQAQICLPCPPKSPPCPPKSPPCPPKSPPCPPKSPPCPHKSPPCPPKSPPCPPKSPPCLPKTPPCPPKTPPCPPKTPPCPPKTPPCPPKTPPCPSKTPPCPPKTPPCPPKPPPCPPKSPPCSPSPPRCPHGFKLSNTDCVKFPKPRHYKSPCPDCQCPSKNSTCPPKPPPCPPKTPPCPPKTPPCPPKTPPCLPKTPPCLPKTPPCLPKTPPCLPKTPPCTKKPSPCCRESPSPPCSPKTTRGKKKRAGSPERCPHGMKLSNTSSSCFPKKNTSKMADCCKERPCCPQPRPRMQCSPPRRDVSPCYHISTPPPVEIQQPHNDILCVCSSPKISDNMLMGDVVSQRSSYTQSPLVASVSSQYDEQEDYYDKCKGFIAKCQSEPQQSPYNEYEEYLNTQPKSQPNIDGSCRREYGVHLKKLPRKISDHTRANVIRLNSKEKITFDLEDDDNVSTREMRGNFVKIRDDDDITLIERKDYKHPKQTVLSNIYNDQKVTGIAAPITINEIASVERETKLNESKSNDSVVNMIEINFKLRVIQGDKTTEINIANDDSKVTTDETKIKSTRINPDHLDERPKEVYILKDEDAAEELNPKNDLNIRIVIKNYKPKAEPTKEKKAVDEFSEKISKKFNTVSTGYSVDFKGERPDDACFSIHRATIDLTTSERSKASMQSNDKMFKKSEVKFEECKKLSDEMISRTLESNNRELFSSGAVSVTENLASVTEVDSKVSTASEIAALNSTTMPTLSDQVSLGLVKTKSNHSLGVQSAILNSKRPSSKNTDFLSSKSLRRSSRSIPRQWSRSEDDYISTDKTYHSSELVTFKTSKKAVKLTDIYKSQARLSLTDTDERDISLGNKTSDEPTSKSLGAKTSEDHTDYGKTSEDPDSDTKTSEVLIEKIPTEELDDYIDLGKSKKEQKKEMLKQVFDNANYFKKPKTKNRIQKLRDMIKALLTSDDTDSEIDHPYKKSVTKCAWNPKSKHNSDSLNNYFEGGSMMVSQTVMNPHIENYHSSVQSTKSAYSQDEDKPENKTCLCSNFAEKLNLGNLMTGGCCCRNQPEQVSEQISCNFVNELTLEDYSFFAPSVECVHCQTNNSRYKSSIHCAKIISISSKKSSFVTPQSQKTSSIAPVSQEDQYEPEPLSDRLSYKSHKQESEYIENSSREADFLQEDTDNLDIEPVSAKMSIKSYKRQREFKETCQEGYFMEEAIKNLDRESVSAKMSNQSHNRGKELSSRESHYQEIEVRRYSSIKSLDQAEADKPTQKINVTETSVKSEVNRKKKKHHTKIRNQADVLQMYETKKAVLEIYAEKTVTDGGEHLVAKLPKYVRDTEGQLYDSYEQLEHTNYKSVYKRNFVMMCIGR